MSGAARRAAAAPAAGVHVRKGRPRDAAAILGVHRAAIRAGCAGHYTAEQIAAWTAGFDADRYREAMARMEFLVAEAAGKVAAFAVVDVETGELHALYVAPGSAGAGIGRALLAAAERVAAGWGVGALHLKSTLNAVGFYERHGYARVGAGINRTPEGLELPCVDMVRSAIAAPGAGRHDGSGGTTMIERIWHGWTTRGNADAYEALLRGRIIPGILGRGLAGFHGIDLLRRDAGDEVEFVTVMRFASLDAVRAFAGEHHEKAVVPAEARALLARFDERSAHYEVRDLPRAGQVTVVARVAARPGMEARVRDALGCLLAPTRAEPGCLNYDLHEAPDRPGEFLFHETWASEEHLRRHLASAHIAAWRAASSDLLARPTEITLWRRAG